MRATPTNRRAPPNGHKWTFAGNMDAPTFSRSINLVGQCHHFIRAGMIEYCSDSRYALAGKRRLTGLQACVGQLPGELPACVARWAAAARRRAGILGCCAPAPIPAATRADHFSATDDRGPSRRSA